MWIGTANTARHGTTQLGSYTTEIQLGFCFYIFFAKILPFTLRASAGSGLGVRELQVAQCQVKPFIVAKS
jgi:hypothetical protein